MDDPTRRCENDTDNLNAPLGALVPKQAPHFFVQKSRTANPGCPATISSRSLQRNVQLGQVGQPFLAVRLFRSEGLNFTAAGSTHRFEIHSR